MAPLAPSKAPLVLCVKGLGHDVGILLATCYGGLNNLSPKENHDIVLSCNQLTSLWQLPTRTQHFSEISLPGLTLPSYHTLPSKINATLSWMESPAPKWGQRP